MSAAWISLAQPFYSRSYGSTIPERCRRILQPRVDHLPPVSSPSIDDVIKGFVPTRRFASVSFASYQPDPLYTGQRAARDRLSGFAAGLYQTRRAGLVGRVMRKQRGESRAIFLRGGHGVGQTPFVSALYSHTCRTPHNLSV